MSDGLVVRGPATAPQPSFEVRVVGNRVQIRATSPERVWGGWGCIPDRGAPGPGGELAHRGTLWMPEAGPGSLIQR